MLLRVVSSRVKREGSLAVLMFQMAELGYAQTSAQISKIAQTAQLQNLNCALPDFFFCLRNLRLCFSYIFFWLRNLHLRF